MPKQLPVALVGVLVFSLIAVGGVASQYEQSVTDSQNRTTVENETFTVAANTTQTLNDSRLDVVYTDSVSVYQNNTSFVASGNYTWNPGNGTLTIPASTSLRDGNTSNITYHYYVPSGAQSTVRDVTLIPFELGGGLGIVVGAALLLGAVVLLGRQR